MRKIRQFGLYGILILMLLLVVFCSKPSGDVQLINDEQRILKQYFLSHNLTTKPLPSGLYYLPTSDTGTGIKPVASDVVLFNFTLSLANDLIIESNNDSIAKMNNIYRGGLLYRPAEYRLSWWFPGLLEGFQLMREGAKARFIIPSSLAYGSAGLAQENIGPYTTVIYDIELLKVIHNPVAYEKAAIEKYVADSIPVSLVVNVNDSGVYHIITKAGSGDFPVTSKIVSIRYKLTLLDGTLIQTVLPTDTPYTYTLGVDQVVAGFDQAVREMKKGEAATVIIPYSQGYGEKATNLPPFSTLVYFMNIVDIE